MYNNNQWLIYDLLTFQISGVVIENNPEIKVEEPLPEVKMACHTYSSSTVKLPIYAGYTKFAMWPSSEMMISCYGLLDVNSILNPVLTGQWVEFPFLPGYTYAAYSSKENPQVSFWINVITSKASL